MLNRSMLYRSAMALAMLAPAALVAQAPAPAGRQLGTVKTVTGNVVTLTTAAGAQVEVTVPAGAPVLQLPPGSTDLKTATPATLADVAAGDRVLATGKAGDTAATLTAARLVLIKGTAIAARNAGEQADWEKRGTGGIVRTVGPGGMEIASGTHTEKVEVSPATVYRRYSPGSVRFEDAKPSTLAQVHTGDQVRVRGDQNADHTSLKADEVVSGSFRNVSGPVTAVDAAASTVTVRDLMTKQPVTVQVTASSDLRHLPAQAAAAFATRNAKPAGAGAAPAAAGVTAAPAGSAPAGGARRSASMDLSKMLARLPEQKLSDLKAGDTVMLVASEGSPAGPGASLTVISLLSGVEQILSSTTAGSEPVTLSPWNLSSPEGGGN